MARPPRPMPKPHAYGCDYCGRQTQLPGRVNCCGCGAPLGVVVAYLYAGTLTENELRRLRGDCHSGGGSSATIEVTTFADSERVFIPQARPIKKP